MKPASQHGQPMFSARVPRLTSSQLNQPTSLM
jgi:hypothetical protein